MVETVLHGVDIEAKKKQVRGKYFVDPSPAKFYPLVISPFPPQVLHLMGDLRLAPPVDDKVRKVRTALGDDPQYLINVIFSGCAGCETILDTATGKQGN